MQERSNEELAMLIKANKKEGNTKRTCELYAELIKNMRPSLEKIVSKYKYCVNFDRVKEDLMQECTMLIIKLVDTYDANKKASFETYAHVNLSYAVWDYIYNDTVSLSIPKRLRKKIALYLNYINKDAGIQVDEGVEFEQINLSKKEIEIIERLPLRSVSLETFIGSNDDTGDTRIRIEDIIADEQAEEEFDRIVENLSLNSCFKKILTEREYDIMMRLIGLGGREYNMEEIAKELGVTSEAIRQAKVRAIKKLKKDME